MYVEINFFCGLFVQTISFVQEDSPQETRAKRKEVACKGKKGSSPFSLTSDHLSNNSSHSLAPLYYYLKPKPHRSEEIQADIVI